MTASTDSEFLETIIVADREVTPADPPQGLVLRDKLGILAHESLDGRIVHQVDGTLFECRATKTPRGDYLLMFPTDTEGRDLTKGTNSHYNGKKEKVNDLLSFRSSDHGRTWQGPKIAFDIDYNQHGFIPIIPRARGASTPLAPNLFGGCGRPNEG